MIWKNSIISFLVNQINLWIRFYEKVHKPVQQSWLKQKRCIKTQNKLIKKKKVPLNILEKNDFLSIWAKADFLILHQI